MRTFRPTAGCIRRSLQRRRLHASPSFSVVKPYLLADIGEGIREVQIIQWFVKPGARVEQFQALCEVQSDKATVEITSRFDGIVKKLHYDADDMAQVGKALCDIDIQSEISEEDAAVTGGLDAEKPSQTHFPESKASSITTESLSPPQSQSPASTRPEDPHASAKLERHRTLATPAVRHMCNDLEVNITDVPGTGKDGRVLKEDVQRYAAQSTNPSHKQHHPPPQQTQAAVDRNAPLTPIQAQMFKTMTRSLSIPHFLYTDTVNLTALSALRARLNTDPARPKLSTLPFLLKATSLALSHYPILNARLDTAGPKPHLVFRAAHNLGFACDTPAGLLVPVIQRVETLTVPEIAAEVARLAALGRAGKLAGADLAGGTFTVSNVGSIGGGVVAPVIVEGQVAIVGVGKARVVPAFGEGGEIVKREECVVSWSADHRVVDGATVARCAEVVRELVEEPGRMLLWMR